MGANANTIIFFDVFRHSVWMEHWNWTQCRRRRSSFSRSFSHRRDRAFMVPTRAPQSPNYSHTVAHSNWSYRAFNTYSLVCNWYWHGYVRAYWTRSAGTFNMDEPMYIIQQNACIMFSEKEQLLIASHFPYFKPYFPRSYNNFTKLQLSLRLKPQGWIFPGAWKTFHNPP